MDEAETPGHVSLISDEIIIIDLAETVLYVWPTVYLSVPMSACRSLCQCLRLSVCLSVSQLQGTQQPVWICHSHSEKLI